MNSRSDLEEERRLFYVAITRAQKSLTMSYASSRYRWGSLVSCEPSRFIEEVDPATVLAVNPKPAKTIVPEQEFSDNWSSFGRQVNTTQRRPVTAKEKTPATAAVPQGFRKLSATQVAKGDFKADDSSLISVGMNVEHEKFGQGKVIDMEGRFPDNKALILFDGYGQKQLLLKFARLKIIN